MKWFLTALLIFTDGFFGLLLFVVGAVSVTGTQGLFGIMSLLIGVCLLASSIVIFRLTVL